MSFNILITSISKKVPLIKSVRHAFDQLNLKGTIIGGDHNSKCIGRFFVDEFWQMPLQNTLTLQEFIDFCKRKEIIAVIPTRDGELTFFAKHQEILAKNGISCMVSSEKTIERCCNKLHFYTFLAEHKLPAIFTTQEINKIQSASYVVKECLGSGSHAIGLNLPLAQAKAWSENLKSPIFQPYIEGREYSVDVYITHQGLPHGAIARVRDVVIDGESQITSSVHLPEMETLCLKAAVQLGISGHAVLQVIKDSTNHLHLIECNARFGGASTLSVAMGLQSFTWFFQECLGLPLSPFTRSPKEMRQIRFPEDKVEIL